MAWIPNFFSNSLKVLSLTCLSSPDSTDFHQDEKMEPRLWCCGLKLNFTPCGSQCTNCGAPKPACSVFRHLEICWTTEKGSRVLRKTWQDTEISHPYCPIWALCPEAPQFRDSSPAVEAECHGKLSPTALTLKKAKDLQEMIQTLFHTSIMTRDCCEKPIIPEWNFLTPLLSDPS